MNIKFEELTIVGKIWTIRELLDKGINEHNKDYILAGIKKLNSVIQSGEHLKSKTTKLIDGEVYFENIVEHSNAIKNVYALKRYQTIGFDKQNNAISKIWEIRGDFDLLKQKAKNTNSYEECSKRALVLQEKVKFLMLNKENTTSNERRDMFKICEEIEDFYTKCSNKLSMSV